MCLSCHSEDEFDDNVEVHICDSNTSFSDFKMKEDIDDDCEYTLTPEKSTFNKSMGELDQNWTPLKCQLGSNFDSCDIKTKQRLVKKAMQAIDNVLYSIAPGQVEALKKECFEQNDHEKEQNELLSCLSNAISDAPGRNTKIQLLSVLYKKDETGNYMYNQNELIEKFQGITIYDIKQARKHASNNQAGMPIEPGKYIRKKLSDVQINHFLDFMQHGGVMQDVASGTHSAKLSNGRKTSIPNAVRTVHKAEVIRLYISACDKEGYTKEQGRPSERTLWNILNNCPASQRKSLAGLDNVASEGSDAFDRLLIICKSIESSNSDKLVKALTDSRRYLKGNYHHHCSTKECDGVADHCLKYALLNPKDPD